MDTLAPMQLGGRTYAPQGLSGFGTIGMSSEKTENDGAVVELFYVEYVPLREEDIVSDED